MVGIVYADSPPILRVSANEPSQTYIWRTRQKVNSIIPSKHVVRFYVFIPPAVVATTIPKLYPSTLLFVRET